MKRVPYVHAGAVPPAEEILKQCVLRPGMEDDKTYSHLANMMVFYKQDDTEYKKSVPSRRAAIRGSPVQVVVNHFNVSPSDYAGMTFLGVTRDHLKDGKSAKTHASAAGMFSVCVDGIVSIIQPRDHLKDEFIALGDYVYYKTNGTDKFEIKDKHMQGRLLFKAGMVPDKRTIGRVVEMRTGDVDEVRVKLLPFGPRRPTRAEKEGSNAKVLSTNKLGPTNGEAIINEAQKQEEEFIASKDFLVGQKTIATQEINDYDALPPVDKTAEVLEARALYVQILTLVDNTLPNIAATAEIKANVLNIERNVGQLKRAVDEATVESAITSIESAQKEIRDSLQKALKTQGEVQALEERIQATGASSMAQSKASTAANEVQEVTAMDTSTSSSIQSALASSLNRDAIRKKRGMEKPKGKDKGKRRKAMGDDALPE